MKTVSIKELLTKYLDTYYVVKQHRILDHWDNLIGGYKVAQELAYVFPVKFDATKIFIKHWAMDLGLAVVEWERAWARKLFTCDDILIDRLAEENRLETILFIERIRGLLKPEFQIPLSYFDTSIIDFCDYLNCEGYNLQIEGEQNNINISLIEITIEERDYARKNNTNWKDRI